MLLTSCATASLTPSKGVGRVRQYDFYSAQLPDSFDGFRVAFATDFHYESRFTARRLPHLIHTLQLLDTDGSCWEEIIVEGQAETWILYLTLYPGYRRPMELMQ